MAKNTKRQTRVTVSPTKPTKLLIPGTWETMSGGGLSADTSKVYDGGSPTPDLLSGPPSAEDIKVARTFDPIKDASWYKAARSLVGRGRFTITKQALDADLRAVGKPDTFANCLFTGISEVEVDSSSSDPQTLELTFATQGAV